MTPKATLIILFSLTIQFGLQAQKEILTDDFTLSVPNDWKSISKEYLTGLEQKNAKAFERNGHKPSRAYIIGYCENDTMANVPPFLIGLFNEMKDYSVVPFDTIVAVNCRAWEKIGIEAEPVKDTVKNRFYVEFELGTEYLFVGYIPGDNGLLQLSFYAEPDNVQKRREQFLTIYNSVNFYLPYFKKNSIEETSKEASKTGYLIALVFLVIVTISRYFIKKSSHAEENKD